MPGYHRAEYWAMLVVCILLRRKRAVFLRLHHDRSSQGGMEGVCQALVFRPVQWLLLLWHQKQGISDELWRERVQKSPIAARRRLCRAAIVRPRFLAQYETNWRGRADEPHFLYVGRLSPEKGLDDLFAAFGVIHAQVSESKIGSCGFRSTRAGIGKSRRQAEYVQRHLVPGQQELGRYCSAVPEVHGPGAAEPQ